MYVSIKRPLIDNVLSELPFAKAHKTKEIKAKALTSLLIDESVLTKFLLDTLEGKQVLRASSMVCLAEGGEVWQQQKSKLLAKYDVVGIDDTGWLVCRPKPENEVLATVVAEHHCDDSGFSLIGQWGEEVVLDGKQFFLQYGVVGDYVLQSLSDPNDRWIVKGKLFESTYEWLD
jgi:hypothetical protein